MRVGRRRQRRVRLQRRAQVALPVLRQGLRPGDGDDLRGQEASGRRLDGVSARGDALRQHGGHGPVGPQVGDDPSVLAREAFPRARGRPGRHRPLRARADRRDALPARPRGPAESGRIAGCPAATPVEPLHRDRLRRPRSVGLFRHRTEGAGKTAAQDDGGVRRLHRARVHARPRQGERAQPAGAEPGLADERYDSREIKRLPDRENPLRDVNRLCFLLRLFLDSHNGFDRSRIGGYLDLFSVMMNPPRERMEKAAMVLDRAMSSPKTLYREFYSKNPS